MIKSINLNTEYSDCEPEAQELVKPLFEPANPNANLEELFDKNGNPVVSYDGAVISNLEEFKIWSDLYLGLNPVEEYYYAWVESAEPVHGAVELGPGKFVFFEEAREEDENDCW